MDENKLKAQNSEDITEKDLIYIMNEMFGDDKPKRIKKLVEEVGELEEAAFDYLEYGTDKLKESVKDELSDVYAVLIHIASIMGISPKEMADNAIDKITGRMNNPNYKREHPHVKTEGDN